MVQGSGRIVQGELFVVYESRDLEIDRQQITKHQQ